MKKNVLKYAGFVLLAAVLVLLDQLTKQWAVNTLMGKDDIILIPGVLQLHFLKNAGMAFGMLQNKQVFFYIMTIVILLILLYILIKLPAKKRFMQLVLAMSVVSGGAVGNLIDRVANQSVVDFIYFSLINFPVFNFADICVTCGCIWLIILLCFVYKDEELKAVFTTKKKDKEG